MWLLGCVLPSMIGHLVAEGDRYWLNFLKLLDIMDILLAPSVTPDETYHLEMQIEEHHMSLSLYIQNSVSSQRCTT